jgi:tetratricopeptide (TPR) repeat protein
LENLIIKISSNDPAVLSWPWEALYNDENGYIAQHCHIERQINNICDTVISADDLPENQLNILYVIARPYENDADFQTLARPLVDFISDGNWPVRIDVLRPPTFERLRDVLSEKQNFYHIFHFDGHGGFADGVGSLIFEKDNDPDYTGNAVSADLISDLLREYKIPYVILNACRSAMLSEQNESSSSVALSMIKSGVRGVVAMGYNLWVSGAEVFLPAFYKSLFENGNIAEAVQAGQKEMYKQKNRDTFVGAAELNDWLVPVFYNQAAEQLALPKLIKNTAERESLLPFEVQELSYKNFIGRSASIFLLERTINKLPQASVLIHGMAGEGKTTLVKGFLQWLEATGYLKSEALWFDFRNIRSVEYIINTIADSTEPKFGTYSRETLSEKLNGLIESLRNNPHIIVWDNFESASGIEGTDVSAFLSENDRLLLKQFLNALHNGKTKVIITSRSTENWLTPHECVLLPLEGLKNEELWSYCNTVISDLGLTLNRDNDYIKLMDKLSGNPLAVRSILLRLNENTAEELLSELENEFKGTDADESNAHIQAALSVFGKGLNSEFASILQVLGLHEQYVDLDYLEWMAQEENEEIPIMECFNVLGKAGLCNVVGDGIYRLHPALRTTLSRMYPADMNHKQNFVEMLAKVADIFIRRQPHEQHDIFIPHNANFHRALTIARELDMRAYAMALTQGMALYAQNIRNFAEAIRLYEYLAVIAEKYEDFKRMGTAYHQQGNVAYLQGDLPVAKELYKRALEIRHQENDEAGLSKTYHQIGMLAQQSGEYETAMNFYKDSLEIKLRIDDEEGAIMTYHQMGNLACLTEEYDTAEEKYKQALTLSIKLKLAYYIASTNHQLGLVAKSRENYVIANSYYMKSLFISLENNDEHSAANTYVELGNVACWEENDDLARKYFREAIRLYLKHGDEYNAELAKDNLLRIDTIDDTLTESEE